MSAPLEIEASAAVVRVRIPAGLALAEAGAGLTAFCRAAEVQRAAAVEMDLSSLGAEDEGGEVLALTIAQWCRDHQRPWAWQGGPASLAAAFGPLRGPRPASGDPERSYSVFEQVGQFTLDFLGSCRAMASFIGELTHAVALAVRRPGRTRWADLVYYMDRCGTDGLPIVVLICFLMGLILGFQAAVQMHVFGADIFVADLVGLSITRELGPLMVGIICTGRAGSAFAAEIGTMQVNEEIDALVTMGVNPTRFLVLPKVLALMLVMPLLALFGDVAGLAGGFVVGTLQLGLPFVAYWNQTVGALGPWDFLQGLIKSGVFAFLVAGVGCLRGMQTRGGAQGVGVSTTSAVVSGIFLLIVADAGMTFLFTRLGMG